MSSDSLSTNVPSGLTSGNQSIGNGGAAPCPIPLAVSSFVHPWAVDSLNPRANRPDGKPWNESYPDMTDTDSEACFRRIATSGGSEADAEADWKSQLDLCSKKPLDLAAFENFQTALLLHEIGLNEAKVVAEDEALERKRTLEALKLEAANRRERQARGETAEMRALEAASAARRLAATLAAAGASPTVPLGNTVLGNVRSGNGGGNNGRSGNMKSYFTVDGTEVLTDKKEANAIIGNNLSLYRTVEPTLLKRMMDHTGVFWSLDQALLIVAEDRQVLEDKALVLQTDPHYALAFLGEVEANPGFLDKIKLEKLLRMQFRLTEEEMLHYFMFYPYGSMEGKVHDRKAHVECLEAIQKIWWIFFGEDWKHVLQPLLHRLGEGDLVPIFRISVHLDTVQEAHYMMTHQIQLAFCMVAAILRKNEARSQQPSPGEAKRVLIEEIQDVFARTVIPGNNRWANASKILEFKSSGKLTATLTILEKVWGHTTIDAPVERADKHPRNEDTSEPHDHEPRTKKGPKQDQSVCLRNVILQFFGNGTDSFGDVCDEECELQHLPVGIINRSSFEKALLTGPAVFGDSFADDGWPEKLAEAFCGKGGQRKRPVCSLEGDAI